MTAVPVTLNLPEAVVETARDAGLLTDERVSELLVAELERIQRVNRLFENADKLAALEPGLTPEQIQAEIDADRQENR